MPHKVLDSRVANIHQIPNGSLQPTRIKTTREMALLYRCTRKSSGNPTSIEDDTPWTSSHSAQYTYATQVLLLRMTAVLDHSGGAANITYGAVDSVRNGSGQHVACTSYDTISGKAEFESIEVSKVSIREPVGCRWM